MKIDEPIIEFRSFSKKFGDYVVHKNIDFTLKKGELFGLLGGSGAGKSVILRSIIGLEFPSSGKILLFGKDSESFSESDWLWARKRIAYAFQNGALFDSWSVFDNLAFPLREHTSLPEEKIQNKIEETLAEFGLEGSKAKYPRELSGGMQKRLGLARALMLDPEVILYDEPTAGLDPYNTKKIQDMIKKLSEKGISGILVTHDIPIALNVCNRISLLANGSMFESATPQEIMSNERHPIKLFANGNSLETITSALNKGAKQ